MSNFKFIIEKKNNFKHIIGKEYTDTFSEYQEQLAKEVAWEVANEYEAYINSNGHELDDQDKINDIEAITNLKSGEYSFDCGDFTYYITIENNVH